jgi:HSP20 family protein
MELLTFAFSKGAFQLVPAAKYAKAEPRCTGGRQEVVMKSSKTPRRPAASAFVRLSTCNPETLLWEVQQVQLEIARRAYELFRLRGGEHGYDWEDWFRAESELLRPVPVVISETNDRISVRANIGGLGALDLKVAFEPRRIILLGKMSGTTGQPGVGDTAEAGFAQVLCLVDLPAEVRSHDGVANIEAGLLKCELPKVAHSARATTAGA